MDNKKRGPVTVPGKNNSSKNAIKHGATASKLLNQNEQERYEELLTELSNEYHSNNPLIKLQIKRITGLTIQAERVQEVIHAAFMKSRMRANTAAKLITSFKQENARIEELAGRLFDNRNATLIEKSRAVAVELMRATEIDAIPSNEEFMKRLPLTSRYLTDQTTQFNITIHEFLIHEVSQYSEIHQKLCVTINQEKTPKSENLVNKIINSNIENVDLMLLKLFAIWNAKILTDFLSGPEQALNLKESIHIEEQAMLPDAGEMDRLMRYQTTLQRQLSAAIGELLAINKIAKDF